MWAALATLDKVFVYRGAGRKEPGDEVTDPCLRSKKCRNLSCDIQWCLSRNNYKVERCKDFVERWEKCCEAAKLKAAAEEAAAAEQAATAASARASAGRK